MMNIHEVGGLAPTANSCSSISPLLSSLTCTKWRGEGGCQCGPVTVSRLEGAGGVPVTILGLWQHAQMIVGMA